MLSPKKRERVRKKQRKRNTDAHSQGTHADPNGIRATWFSDLHQICHSNNSENKHTHALIFQLKMIYSYLDQHIGSQNADPCALHRIKQSRNYISGPQFQQHSKTLDSDQ